MLKIQVVAGTYFLGSRVAMEKFVYRIRRIFNAENPCKATMNIRANPKSNDALCSNRASPSAADMKVDLLFCFGDPFLVGVDRIASYNRRRGG